MSGTYDAIVVGARCGGAPTAMLLARRGHRVLLLDKASFPSDTLSTHLIHAAGTAALARWGLLDAVAASGAPAIATYTLDYGPFQVSAAPRPTPDGIDLAYAPRRTVLDELLVSAAVDAGVEVRTGVTVEGVLADRGAVVGVHGRDASGRELRELSRVVVGADGRRSHVADWVGAEAYATQPTFAASYFAYWRDVPTDGLEVFIRPQRSFAAFPTNDDLTVIVMSWPRAEFAANRVDIEGNYLRSIDLAPDFAARVAKGRRATRFYGTGEAPGFYRRAFGPGWALVGDARHHKDPVTGKGISEAFLDAEALADALHDVWSDGAGYDERLGHYQHKRDAETMAMYDFTCQLARLEPPPAEMAQLLAAVSESPEAGRDFVSVLAGTADLGDFMHPDNVGRIVGRAA
ncbi:MAG: FAD-dependent monooxygenase [Actinomycetota bacterium]|nr:FAD-dependent monooxygenase [Actinomycetota bacterium]